MYESKLMENPPGGVHWCIVYDSRNGRVVHVHQFIGEDVRTPEKEARNARAHFALQTAERHCDPTHLRVMHAPTNFCLEPGATCSVDLATGELVIRMEPERSLKELKERAPVTEETGPESCD